MMTDEIITEVRLIKNSIGAKFNYDLRALYDDIKRGEAELQTRGIQVIARHLILTTYPIQHYSGHVFLVDHSDFSVLVPNRVAYPLHGMLNTAQYL